MILGSWTETELCSAKFRKSWKMFEEWFAINVTKLAKAAFIVEEGVRGKKFKVYTFEVEG